MVGNRMSLWRGWWRHRWMHAQRECSLMASEVDMSAVDIGILIGVTVVPELLRRVSGVEGYGDPGEQHWTSANGRIKMRATSRLQLSVASERFDGVNHSLLFPQ